MRRKVQAQRKFAQGAYIPPSATSNPPPERRAGTEAPSQAENKNVFYNKMSADMLLDIVSFQNLHKRREPVVVLKRLAKLQDKPAPTPAPVEPNNNREPTRHGSTETNLTNESRHKRMLLRSRLRVNFKPDKSGQKKKKAIRRKLIKKVHHTTRRMKRKLPSQADSYDLEDDKPLKYFATTSATLRSDATKRRQVKIGKDSLRETHSGPDLKKVKKAIQKCPSEGISVEGWLDSAKLSSKSERDTKSFKMLLRPKRQRDLNNFPGMASAPITRKRRTNGESINTLKLKQCDLDKTLDTATQETPAVKKQSSSKEGQVSVKLDHKEPPCIKKLPSAVEQPSSVTKALPPVQDEASLVKKSVLVKEEPSSMKEQLVSATQKQSASATQEQSTATRAESFATHKQSSTTQTQFSATLGQKDEPSLIAEQSVSAYTETNEEDPTVRHLGEPQCDNARTPNETIEGWLQKSMEATTNTFKFPSVPAKRAVRRPDLPQIPIAPALRSRSVDSICSSERFVTVRDIVNASPHELELGCKRRHCHACCRVNKLRQLKNIMHSSTDKRDDIYEFTDDSTGCSMGIYKRRKLPPSTPKSPVASKNDQPVYYDLFPNAPHIIQIIDLNKRNTIVRARVIPKLQADIRNEFSLIEHENLLDQLLERKLESPNNPEDHEQCPINTSKVIDQTTTEVSVIPDEIESETNSVRNRRRAEPSTSKIAKEPSTSKNNNELSNKRSGKQNVTRRVSETNCSIHSAVTRIISSPEQLDNASLVDAPVFYPTEAEFNDPIAYFEKIAPSAAKYGLCKVVAPAGFRPSCSVSDEIRFTVSNQYIARLYSRWGAAAREMCAIRAYLASQSVMFARAPLYEGIEVDLAKLYHIVQRNGGLKNVLEKKRWGRVAEEMRYTRAPNAEKRLDQLYVKYLLPYDTLNTQERKDIMDAVDRCWNKKNNKMLERALNPLHRQKRLLGESDSSGEETAEENDMAWALSEAEDCVVSGRSMTLATFKKVAASAMDTLFPCNEPSLEEVEREYWRLVLLGTDHVCVNTASIDTGEDGHGFTKNKTDPFGKHPWNLKMLSQNTGNVLRSMGPVLGVTVPTLHLGMVFSTSCWHRDPHGLPWIEYMHSGTPSIWYGIADEQSDNFRKAVEALCPTSCQNKSIWLPSDITMIPPELLLEHNVSLSRVVQRPGEFIIVYPKAYSCSICTGYTQSESVYFATASWLQNVTQVFQEVRDSCEPTMFSLEQLLIAVAKDPRVPMSTVADMYTKLSAIVKQEIDNRKALVTAGVPFTDTQLKVRQQKKRPAGAWNVREQDECEICRSTLYLSKVVGLTGKRSSVCLQHALRLLQTGHKARDGNLVLFLSQQELEEALESAERRCTNMASSSTQRRTATSTAVN